VAKQEVLKLQQLERDAGAFCGWVGCQWLVLLLSVQVQTLCLSTRGFFFSFKIDSSSYRNEYREETATRSEGSVSVAKGQQQTIIIRFQRDFPSDQRPLCWYKDDTYL